MLAFLMIGLIGKTAEPLWCLAVPSPPAAHLPKACIWHTSPGGGSVGQLDRSACLGDRGEGWSAWWRR